MRLMQEPREQEARMRGAKVLLGTLLAASLFVFPAAAEYPDRPIKLIVPQAAGSATDHGTRIRKTWPRAEPRRGLYGRAKWEQLFC